MPPPGRILAVDWGRRRIGLAVCDELGLTVRGLDTLVRTNREADLEALGQVAAREEAALVVVGRPLALDGTETKSSGEAARFGRTLAKRLRLPLELHDERLTSREAEDLLRSRGRPYAKADVDRVAASLLLESFLAARREEVAS